MPAPYPQLDGGAGYARAVTARLGRRAFLVGAGAGAGLLLARGLGVSRWPRGRRARPAPRTRCGRSSPRSRRGSASCIVLPADHPSRQIANTIAVLERPHLGTLLSPYQQALEGPVLSMLSPRGRAGLRGHGGGGGPARRVRARHLRRAGARPGAQAVIMGGHMMLRGGGEGPGRRVRRRPGLRPPDRRSPLARARATRSRSTATRPTGSTRGSRAGARARHPGRAAARAGPPGAGRGRGFPGVRGSLSEPAREEAARLVETVFASYPRRARRARPCIDGNGGLGALHVAYYASHGFYEDMRPGLARRPRAGAARRSLLAGLAHRGAGDVIHFKGHPHVHAYVEVVRDPARANIGKSLGVVAARWTASRCAGCWRRRCAGPAARPWLSTAGGARTVLRRRGHHRARLRARSVPNRVAWPRSRGGRWRRAAGAARRREAPPSADGARYAWRPSTTSASDASCSAGRSGGARPGAPARRTGRRTSARTACADAPGPEGRDRRRGYAPDHRARCEARARPRRATGPRAARARTPRMRIPPGRPLAAAAHGSSRRRSGWPGCAAATVNGKA